MSRVRAERFDFADEADELDAACPACGDREFPYVFAFHESLKQAYHQFSWMVADVCLLADMRFALV